MRTILVLPILFSVAFFPASAQEYTVAANDQSRLVLKDLDDISVEGYDGSEVVFTALNHHRDRSERAEGLKLINGLGLEDNTGIGLTVDEAGSDINVMQLSRKGDTDYRIQVPRNISVVYTHSSPHGDRATIRDVSGELEVSTLHNDVTLENITGPMTIKSVHGEIDANLAGNIRGPISIVSTHGVVDVSIPASTPANIEMMANYGEMYTDLNIEMADSASDLRKISASVVKGTINGGSDLTIELSSSHGNIYLRQASSNQ